jgi:uncharacterized protein DUF4160
MPTIAIVEGVRLMIHLKDHLPPHLHAIFAGFEAQISIATGGCAERLTASGEAEDRPALA